MQVERKRGHKHFSKGLTGSACSYCGVLGWRNMTGFTLGSALLANNAQSSAGSEPQNYYGVQEVALYGEADGLGEKERWWGRGGGGPGSHTCCIRHCRTEYTSVYRGWTTSGPDESENNSSQLSYSHTCIIRRQRPHCLEEEAESTGRAAKASHQIHALLIH